MQRLGKIMRQGAARALFLFVALLSLAAAATYAGAQLRFDTQSLTIETQAGERHQLTVELALDGPQRQQGLMFRKQMAPDAGMLFDFGAPRDIAMWMRNTLIPLDMLFIGEDGRISHIHAQAQPHSEAIISGPVKFVLELNGGEAGRRHIAIGDMVLSHQIGNSP
jgi:uncharacterized protein